MATGAARKEASWSAIVLAAGAGRRFGGRKLLAPFGGGPLIEGALGAAFASPASTIILVTGSEADDVAAAARAWAERQGEGGRLQIIHAADHAEGMGASLRTGAEALPADTAGTFVLLGDMPRIPAAILPRLVEAVEAGAAAAAPICGGRRGHPVLFGAELLDHLRQAAGDEGARTALAGLGPRLALIETEDEGALFDVDRPEDLAGA
ncbi:nucleotidyltransferase family protein [Phenylobacterium sp.]|jgi:molybdenum cofactor cytidylyltransferase|uniref:nucleotidyltransferase family protein n=1 Tax=Phenylobacterium sp. TaxID=1871053 RepID=UPI000C96224C|nr:nucleotidyltransferase family protein [Phenylobacterium sp.]MAK82451.1 molybdopterin-guanine dinucleotide biosynthesis protein MobA [Phenylobacterium sp.]|tara:strand:+ start:61364 stop:61987 length:624 start_codon:yes stop_codon:yes gene_type:complete